jgi:molybdate transport system substrate-binding protein
MRPHHLKNKLLPALAALALAAGASAQAADLHVVSSGGFAQAYKDLSGPFERASGDHLVSEWGPSMGVTKNAIPARLARGEPIDVVIMVGDALDKLMAEGRLEPGSKVVLANSPIACAVRHGAAKPDIGTVDGLRQAFLHAHRVAYSDSASGEYIKRQLMDKLGIRQQMEGKAAQIPATPVGEIVAHGEAELGFQQISELKPVHGIDIVGPLPNELQEITIFSAGIAAGSKEPEAGRALIKFLASPAARDVIIASGMEPIPAGGAN